MSQDPNALKRAWYTGHEGAHSLPVGSQTIDSKLELSESQHQFLKRVKRPSGNEEPLEFEKELYEMTELALNFHEELQSWKRPPCAKTTTRKISVSSS